MILVGALLLFFLAVLCVWVFTLKHDPVLSSRWVFLSIIAGSQGMGWLMLTSFLSFSGSYAQMVGSVPRLWVIGVIPVFLVTFLLLRTPFMAQFCQSIPLRWVMGLCVARIPIEMILIHLARKSGYSLALSGAGLNSEIWVGMAFGVLLLMRFGKSIDASSKMFYFLNRLGQFSVLWVFLLLFLGPKVSVLPVSSDDIAWAVKFPFTWLFTLYYPLMWLLHGMLLKRSTGRS